MWIVFNYFFYRFSLNNLEVVEKRISSIINLNYLYIVFRYWQIRHDVAGKIPKTPSCQGEGIPTTKRSFQTTFAYNCVKLMKMVCCGIKYKNKVDYQNWLALSCGNCCNVLFCCFVSWCLLVLTVVTEVQKFTQIHDGTRITVT